MCHEKFNSIDIMTPALNDPPGLPNPTVLVLLSLLLLRVRFVNGIGDIVKDKLHIHGNLTSSVDKVCKLSSLVSVVCFLALYISTVYYYIACVVVSLQFLT